MSSSYGLFGRVQRLEQSRVKFARLNEKQLWRQPQARSARRFRRVFALQETEDCKHTLSSCILWLRIHPERPELHLSYKHGFAVRVFCGKWCVSRLFDRWIHKPVPVQIENWSCHVHHDDEFVVFSGDVSPRHFRLIDRVASYLIPQLEKLTIDITWHPALHNPKLQIPNLHAVTICSTEQGVEFVCSDRTSARVDINLKDASLQLVCLKQTQWALLYSRCLSRNVVNISDLSEAIKILELDIVHESEERAGPSSRNETSILRALKKLDVTVETAENLRALQHIRSSLDRQTTSILRVVGSMASLWIQYGLVPCLLSLLLDPTKYHCHLLFQSIKGLCKALIMHERELASKAILLYILRALQQYGLQCKTILVLLSALVEDAIFRKIAVESFDLGQQFSRLLLIRTSLLNNEMSSASDGLLLEHELQVPPMHIIHEQLQLPDAATVAWRVPPLPLRRTPPEQPLAQISILKNLLLLSPLNNDDDVEYRSGHLTTMLLAFLDRRLKEQEKTAKEPFQALLGNEQDNFWFHVTRLVMANIHEHTYLHPVAASFASLPQFQAFKPSKDLRAVDGFVRQVLEMIVRNPGSRVLMTTGFQLLTDLVTSSPAGSVSSLIVSQLIRLFFSIRLPPVMNDVGVDRKAHVHLAAFDLLEALLLRSKPFSVELIGQFMHSRLIARIFQAMAAVSEQRDMGQISEDEQALWTQKCWRLLSALVQASRAIKKTHSMRGPLSIAAEAEEQFAQELLDPYHYRTSDSTGILATLSFFSVYLDAPECLLYDQVYVFLRFLGWIRETLNDAWGRSSVEIVVAALDVVAAVCGNVSAASYSIVQSLVDALLVKLEWIPREVLSENEMSTVSDRTVPVSGGSPADWRRSRAGPSQLPPLARKPPLVKRPRNDAEIQPEDQNFGVGASATPNTLLRKSDMNPVVSTEDVKVKSLSLALPAHPSTETETASKVEHFRARHALSSQEKGPNAVAAMSRPVVIPPLDLAGIAMVREWQQGRKSVASTVYSSEYPVRPLSQLSDQSGIYSNADGARLTPPLLSIESEPSLSRDPDLEQTVFGSELYQGTASKNPSERDVSIHNRVAAVNVESEKIYYMDSEKTDSSSEDLGESDDEGCLFKLSSRSSDRMKEERPVDPLTITLEKRAYSTSAIDKLPLTVNRRPSLSQKQSAELNKVHSFDKKRSRPSLAMQHLVGRESSRIPVTDTLSTPHLWTGNSLPNILFSAETADAPASIEIDDRDEEETQEATLTGNPGSQSTEAKEMEVEWMLQENEDGSYSDAATYESQTLLIAKYQLKKCDLILEHHMVHASVLKVLLRFLAADYHNGSAERVLPKMIALGLHKHFHYVPKNILMILKDWSIQLDSNKSHLVLKMLSKRLFDENRYPSLRRIGRGIFSSIHECSCPVLGGPSMCCVKVIDLPKDPHGMRSLKDLSTELAILQSVQQLPCVINLYDFGTTEGSLYLVTKLCAMDLLTWRQCITDNIFRSSKMMFKIFAEIVKSVDALHEAGVVHFDLKCSNILLDVPDDATGNVYDWDGRSELPFGVVLADFGEAMLLDTAKEGLQRSRGTQAFMSPEMLVSSSGAKRVAPGVQSDAWSLGCLFFELITGQLIFDDSDYSEFHTRLTTTSRTLIDAKKIDLIPEAIQEPVLMCLSYLLVRNPAMRAPLHAVAEWLEYVISTDALPEPKKIASVISKAQSLRSVQNRRGFEHASLLPKPEELDLRKDFLPLSSRVSVIKFSAAKDPWFLSEHCITHVVFVHFMESSTSEADFAQIKNSTIRANGMFFDVQISAEEGNSILSWTEHCQRCCENVLLSCQSVIPCQIAIVPGKSTGQCLMLMSRFLTQDHKHQDMNLDSSLLM